MTSSSPARRTVERPPLTTWSAGQEATTRAAVAAMLNRHPVVGLAVGIVRDGQLAFFHGHGVADTTSGAPVTPDTIFRIGSLTKTVTAIAVLQLAEEGLVELDAPAGRYLRAYRLVPAKPWHRPPTVRQLLTHTAGLPQLAHPLRALQPILGETVPHGQPVPPLADFYRGRLRLVAEPGSGHTYSNHGFATLGQIVTDLTGRPLGDHLRERIFEPLGMADTGLARTPGVRRRLATGYALRSRGPQPVADTDIITTGAGSLYSSTRDMGRYVAALLAGGTGEHGPILRPETLASMFAPQYRPDPRVPGCGLGFFRGDAGGHAVVHHDGLVPGFSSQLAVAPTDDLGIVAFTNGARGAHLWLGTEVSGLLRTLIGAPAAEIRGDVPHHAETWPDLCGRYTFRGSPRDVQKWFVAGARVAVRHGRLALRPATPVPALLRWFPLFPDDEDDPGVFRIDLSAVDGGTTRVVFGRAPGGRVTGLHLEFGTLSFDKRS
ncbi:serine hydrolase domain-containing protein [Amycolatopsis sp. NPDC021455]|uniref:serine hydrolase domain-containing protein n=1 Tax=Amycolatopsis sp. NPDC021455 TaxID=3154901 RepID=UPI0033EC1499